MREQYGHIFLYLFMGMGISIITLGLAALLRFRNPDPKRGITYECGMEPVGSTDIRFNIRFYMYALVFVIFDVEVLYLFPWAVSVSSLGMVALVEMGIFLAVLFLGLVYAWQKGALRWE